MVRLFCMRMTAIVDEYGSPVSGDLIVPNPLLEVVVLMTDDMEFLRNALTREVIMIVSRFRMKGFFHPNNHLFRALARDGLVVVNRHQWIRRCG